MLDSSVLISAFLTPRGTCAELLRAGGRGAFVLCLSPELLADMVAPLLRERKDDVIMATAVKAQADYLVTGDRRHLLSLGEYEGIRIVTPRQLLELLERD